MDMYTNARDGDLEALMRWSKYDRKRTVKSARVACNILRLSAGYDVHKDQDTDTDADADTDADIDTDDEKENKKWSNTDRIGMAVLGFGVFLNLIVVPSFVAFHCHPR